MNIWTDHEPADLTDHERAVSRRLLDPGAWRSQKPSLPWLALLIGAGLLAGLIIGAVLEWWG